MTTPRLMAVEATDREKLARDALCHAAWDDQLSVEQFVEREAALRATAFARRGMTTWLLVEEGDPARRPLASLETYQVACRHGLRAGEAYEIASVFTEAALRGQGHASRLLELVAGRLAARPRALALTLYSDVGAPIYARVGFTALPAADWRFPAAVDPAPLVRRTDGDAEVARVLGARRPRGRFAILPDAAQVAWHRQRERQYLEALRRGPMMRGVLSTAGGDALVCADHKNERALVLAWWADDAASAARLCAAAADEAARVGLREVVAWAPPIEPEDDPFAAALPWVGGEKRPRAGSLPMLRPLPRAPGLVADAWREVPRLLWV